MSCVEWIGQRNAEVGVALSWLLVSSALRLFHILYNNDVSS